MALALFDDYDNGNIFAKIIKGEIPKHLVYENDDLMVIMDIMPQAPGHALVLAKSPARNVVDVSAETWQSLMTMTRLVARAVARAFVCDGVVVSQFSGSVAGQTIPHIHVHIVPCRSAPESFHMQLNVSAAVNADLAANAASLRTELMKELN